MTPLAHNLRACLPGLAERTREQLFQLYGELTPERCDLMVIALQEVATVCRRLCAELQRGESPTV
ncbi:hypothetical protein [Lysobacter tyrosinilyticus]